jgi:hypothetical protein
VVQRELPLAVAACICREYVISLLHPVPACPDCSLTPSYVRDTLWYLGLDYE